MASPTNPRLRKAWTVIAGGAHLIYYAPSASKARASAIADLMGAWGVSWREGLDEIGHVWRALEQDVSLPERHPLAPQLHPEILHCVVHAYGGTGLKAGYRDHFYTSADDWQMRAALYHTLFSVYRREKGRDGRPGMIMYELTDLGRDVARGEAKTYPRCWE